MVEYLHDENLVLLVYTSRGFCRDKNESGAPSDEARANFTTDPTIVLESCEATNKLKTEVFLTLLTRSRLDVVRLQHRYSVIDNSLRKVSTLKKGGQPLQVKWDSLIRL